MYQGPDLDYVGAEIAVCFNGSGGVAIVNVTDKTDMALVSSFGYANSAYTHQGWLSEDHSLVFFNDELDEMNFGNGTRTYIADVTDLDNPVVLGFYEASNTAIDHNLYVRGNKIYASNYLSGLRSLKSKQTAAFRHSLTSTPTQTAMTLPSVELGATTRISQVGTLSFQDSATCSWWPTPRSIRREFRGGTTAYPSN